MIKTLLIILFILPINMALAIQNTTSLNSSSLDDIIDPPNTAALNIMLGALSSLKELRKQNKATLENVRTLIKIKLLPNIAMDVSARLALEKHWNTLNNQQQYIFQQYITESLIRDYAGVLGAYERLDSINISVNPKVKRKGNKALVKLLIAFNENPNPFKVTLKMVYSDRWRVYDLMFSGVSLIKNYQAQFDSHIRRKGIDSLIKKTINKLSKG
ncbi:MAG: ABC transporter substrate-binding protein [Gammaproteobacteria bacterium]|nr:ABC transporter substrate-binding protein [Gammaproteobacteria bacterium]